MPEHAEHHPDVAPWVVAASVAARVTLPDGEAVDRDGFHAWLWERAAGLLGVDEGTVTATDAAARGLIPARQVIDAAAAPADRDWVATLAIADEAWWFVDESAARSAVTLVAATLGCRLVSLHAADAVDHEAVSRQSFSRIAVPGFGIVRPAWEEGAARVAADGLATMYIEPGLGFGTGLHETTQLCLTALAERHRHGGRCRHVLDFGSGSGILAIAAAVLGATRVDAVEIDDRVHGAIAANARRNGVGDRLCVFSGLPEDGETYDVVIANIVAHVLLEHAAVLCRRVAQDRGTVVLSGLLADDVAMVADRYTAILGSRPLVEARGDWRMLSFVVG
ncbi:MAG: 50S ribosomal protein L11 methyltransferase [Planctomycetia bacterium]